MDNYLQDLFIDDVKGLLNRGGASISDEQVEAAVTDYLEENPIQSATATVENGVLKVT